MRRPTHVYHATTLETARRAALGGLVPLGGLTYAGPVSTPTFRQLADRSRRRLFFTELQGLAPWMATIGDLWLDAGKGDTMVALRVRPEAVEAPEGWEKDTTGSSHTLSRAWMVREGYAPRGALEVCLAPGWVPLLRLGALPRLRGGVGERWVPEEAFKAERLFRDDYVPTFTRWSDWIEDDQRVW